MALLLLSTYLLPVPLITKGFNGCDHATGPVSSLGGSMVRVDSSLVLGSYYFNGSAMDNKR
jgi:hypothetical protein